MRRKILLIGVGMLVTALACPLPSKADEETLIDSSDHPTPVAPAAPNATSSKPQEFQKKPHLVNKHRPVHSKTKSQKRVSKHPVHHGKKKKR